MPLSLVDGSKGAWPYALAQSDLALGDFPVIARVPPAQGFLGHTEGKKNMKPHQATILEWVVIRITFMSWIYEFMYYSGVFESITEASRRPLLRDCGWVRFGDLGSAHHFIAVLGRRWRLALTLLAWRLLRHLHIGQGAWQRSRGCGRQSCRGACVFFCFFLMVACLNGGEHWRDGDWESRRREKEANKDDVCRIQLSRQ